VTERAVAKAEGETIPPLSALDSLSRTDVIADRIRTAILRGDFQPGQALVERDLAAMLGVSKTPIREALRMLASSGLVTTVPFRGVTVRETDSDLARAIYEVRLLLEPAAAERALPAQSADRILEARSILREAAAAGRAEDYASLTLLNRRFHRFLYDKCGNPVLCSVLDGVHDQVALITTHGWRRRSTWAEEAEQHNSILDAVETRDPDATRERLRRHIDESLRRLVEVLSDAPQLRPSG
jgi:DNA-binding GntR family transcriptional regulator